MRCTLFFSTTVHAPSAETSDAYRELWIRSVRAVSVHSGKPCEDPNCPFRAPIPRTHERMATPVADELRAAAGELRRRLGLSVEPKKEIKPREPDAPHFCHVPTCKEQCPRAHLMCARHWYQVPRDLQQAVLRAYVPGQEHKPALVTETYLAAARAAIEAVLQQERPEVEPPPDPQLVLFK